MKNPKLCKNTVSDTLWKILKKIMEFDELKDFRLVGGTSLSLQLGHRISVDIDLFSDEEYGSIDFYAIDRKLKSEFPVISMFNEGNETFGKSYYIGYDDTNIIKLDLFYTDKYVFPILEIEGIRMATCEEIAAMKMEVIGNNGRKKDFWDIHELLNQISLAEILRLHALRYPYTYGYKELKFKLLDFEFADNDFDPICLLGKYWELIKLDIQEAALALE